MKERKKGQWSKEAKERQRQRMKERFGVNRDPLPSIVREREYKENPVYIQQEIQPLAVDEEGSGEEMQTDTYISKRDFDYDTGVKFEHGQVVELRGLPNDEKLVKLGYVIPYKVRGDENECIQCGKSFGSTSGYMMHVAAHYEKCGVCNRSIPPEEFQKHREAHAILA